MIRSLVFCTLILLGPAGGAAPAQELGVDEVLKIYQANAEMLYSCNVKVQVKFQMLLEEVRHGNTFEYKPISDPDTDRSYVYRQLIKGELLRLDIVQDAAGEHPVGTVAVSWDGELYKNLNFPGRTASVEGSPRMMQVLGHSDLPTYQFLFRQAFGDLPLWQFIAERDATMERDENGLIVIRAAPAPSEPVHANIYGLDVRLDPSRGFLPVQQEWYVTKQETRINLTRVFTEYQEVQPGLYVPATGRLEYLVAVPAAKRFGEPWATTTFDVLANDSAYNIPIEDEEFEVDFPLGVKVADRVANTTYIVGAENQEETLRELAKEGRLGITRLKTGANPRRSMNVVRILVAVNITLVIILAAVVFIRRKSADSN